MTYHVTQNGVLTVWFCNGLKIKESGAGMRVGYDWALKPQCQLISKGAHAGGLCSAGRKQHLQWGRGWCEVSENFNQPAGLDIRFDIQL